MEVFQGELYVGGDFTVAGGVRANRIARWNGTSWSDVAGSKEQRAARRYKVRTLPNTMMREVQREREGPPVLMTETGPVVMALDAEMALSKIGSSGKSVLHCEIRLVDESGRDVTEPDTVGEIWVRRGPNITPGYWNQPEVTAEAFAGEWFRTGDAATRDGEGFYYIVDRWKDMFISGGENVYPVEVENVIYQLSGVLENAVVGVPDEKWGEVGRAYVVLKDGANLDEGAVIDHCKSQLATYKVPKQVRLIEELPHNATGKILKHQLDRD